MGMFRKTENLVLLNYIQIKIPMQNISNIIKKSVCQKVTDKLKDITDQIRFKEKRRESANNLHQYKECDKLAEQISSLKSEKQKLDLELKSVNKRNQQSKMYHKHKKTSVSSSVSSGYEHTASGHQGTIDCSDTESLS